MSEDQKEKNMILDIPSKRLSMVVEILKYGVIFHIRSSLLYRSPFLV